MDQPIYLRFGEFGKCRANFDEHSRIPDCLIAALDGTSLVGIAP